MDDTAASRESLYEDMIREFVPHSTCYFIAARALVPVVCSVFHTHDSIVTAGVDERLPWDVLGGVIATLFAVPTVKMSLKEYQEQWDDADRTATWSGHIIKVEGPVGEQTYGNLQSPKAGTGIVLDVSALEGIENFMSNRFAFDYLPCERGKSLTAVRLGSSLRRFTSTPHYFCSRNKRLERLEIDVDGLLNVTTIGEDFLSCCAALRSVDLRPLRNTTAIDEFFLGDCRSLESIDLSPFDKVTSISQSFLQACNSLTSIDFSPLRSIKTIDVCNWLSRCRGLRGTIDLTPLRGVEVCIDEEYEFGEFLDLYYLSIDDSNDDLVTITEEHRISVRVPSDNRVLVDAVRRSLEDHWNDDEFRDRITVEEVPENQ